MHSRKFPSLDEAIAHLEPLGKLEYFGRVGSSAEIYVYKLTLPDTRIYRLFVYEDGNIEVMP